MIKEQRSFRTKKTRTIPVNEKKMYVEKVLVPLIKELGDIKFLSISEHGKDCLNGMCYFCGTWTNVQMHHILKYSCGGESSWRNCLPVCCKCHRIIENRAENRIQVWENFLEQWSIIDKVTRRIILSPSDINRSIKRPFCTDILEWDYTNLGKNHNYLEVLSYVTFVTKN